MSPVKNNTVGFVIMLDVSGSMYSAMPMVKIDAKAFVRQAKPKDQFAINQFSDNASWVYPQGASPGIITVSDDLHETEQSLNYIENIKSLDMTNISDAIRLGNDMIKKANTDIKAFVLLSDGIHNMGVDPSTILGTEPAIYIAGLGSIYKPYFDTLIAKNKKSKFYNKPNAYEMMLMFNEIRADSFGGGLVTNNLHNYRQGSDYVLQKFNVSGDGDIQLNTVWSGANYQYTSGDPHGNFINIQLLDPNEKRSEKKPDIAENGYCIFNMKNVQPGEWKVLIQYDIPSAINGTIGGVEFNSSIRLDIDAPKAVKSGDSIPFNISLTDEGKTIEGITMNTRITKPSISVDNAMQKYASELKKMTLDDCDDTANDDITKLMTLRNEKLKDIDILAPKYSFDKIECSKDGEYTYAIDGAEESGIYTIDVTVEGISTATNKPFSRVKSYSVAVK